jgi:hypothetical protein
MIDLRSVRDIHASLPYTDENLNYILQAHVWLLYVS